MSAFEDLGVMPEIICAVEELEWVLPTPIQQEAIPLILGGGDVLAAAETGSGKTGAFALPILQITYETINKKAEISVPATTTDNNGEQEQESTTTTKKIEWSTEDRDKDLAINGLLCQSRAKDWAGGRVTYGVSKAGKYYYEATVKDEGLCRVGWSLKKGTRSIGTDKFSWGYGGTGKKSHENKFENFGVGYGLNDVIGCLLDTEAGTITFTKNGEDFGQAYQLDATKLGQVFYPAVLLKNAEMGFNFGQSSTELLKHLPKGGYIPMCQGELEQDQTTVTSTTTTTTTTSAQVSNNNNNNNKKGGGKNQQQQQSQQPQEPRKPLSLIIEPVKELADQTYSAILNFSKYLTSPKIEPVLCLGSDASASKRNIKDLNRNGDIVVGTPGVLDKYIREGVIDVSQIKFFVLDEADQLIRDNLSILNYIYNRLPKQGLQVLFFSATLHSNDVVRFAEQITRQPTWVDLKGKDYIPELIQHTYVTADPEKFEFWKDALDTTSEKHVPFTTDAMHAMDVKSLDRLKTPEQKSLAIKYLKPQLLVRVIRAFKMDQALIFARTRVDCDNLQKYLQAVGGGLGGLESEFSSVVLHGEKQAQVRKQNLEKFKNGDVKYLICTDVASRGIDIQGLPFVINYTLPDTFEDYIHRVGRVGRADRLGVAVSIVGKFEEKVWYHGCRDRGKGCHNTKLVEQKGCAIWYNEPDLFQAISEKVSPVQLNDQFQLDDMEIIRNVGKFSNESSNKINEYQAHTEELKNKVIELANLEETIQRDYLNLPLKFK
ncbi:putative RNA helicase [Cavenderia fasciculata]|uniref:DEAD box protein 1 n=1 Tax=Cavenderia fasciculata TaxID=261658 RepID=F4PMW8_CACFS|nr:putative RNA helicase [Cavenderia fasciculata]EGG23712.1 putative RNA helicase [Cavenderia fasciculata]|eukprot:XP_004361563.1 putative RNA helicase [Cavenderia fasciculata]